MATSPIPLRAPLTEIIIDPASGQERDTHMLASAWIQWFLEQQQALAKSGTRVGNPLSIPATTGALGSTPIPLPGLSAGLYLVSVFTHVTTAAGVSSSVAPVVTFTDLGIACSLVGGALTDNTIATVGSDVWLIRVDAGTPISLSTTYSSSGSPAMAYSMAVTVARAS